MGLKNFNKSFNSIEWGVDAKDFEFKRCSDMQLGVEYALKGLYISKDRGYGHGAVAILDGFKLNLPTNMLETVRDILKDEESIEEIKSGKASVVISSYISDKYKKTGYSVEFVVK